MPRASGSSERHVGARGGGSPQIEAAAAGGRGDSLQVRSGEAFASYARRVSARWTGWITAFVLVCIIVWWPLETLLHGGSGRAEDAFSLLRWVLAPLNALALALHRFTGWVERRPYLFGFFAITPQLVLLGWSSGQAGGLDGPWMFLVSGATGISLVFVLSLGPRIAASSIIAAAMVVGFLLHSPRAVEHTLFPLLISHMIFVAAVFTAVGHVVYRLIERSYQHQQRLVELNETLESRVARATEELRELTHRLQVAVDDERAEMALEIHDHLGQELTALQFAARMLRRRSEAEEPLAPALGEVDALLARTRETMHRLIARLEPRTLAQLGLVRAVQATVEDFGERTGLTVNVAIEPEQQLLRDPLATRQSRALYAVLCEALNNVGRHAAAAEVWVRLRRVAGALELEVEDDGQGFDDETSDGGGGMGVVGIRERAASLGGEASFGASDRGGARVCVRVPE